MRKVTCACESVFNADLPEEIDLDAEPGRIGEILGGDFLSVACPACGKKLKPELRVRLFSKSRGMDLVVLPELERMALYRGAASLPRGSQALVGYAELYERAMIISDSLDADAVEIMKYYVAAKATDQAPEAEIGVAYAGRDGDRLTFHVSGLREGEIAVLHLGADSYSKTLDDKARTSRSAPFDRIFKGPYRSIRALEAEAEGA